MFGLGFLEILVISLVAIIFLGPRELPAFARALARAVAQVQKTLDEARGQLSTFDLEPEEESKSCDEKSGIENNSGEEDK